MLNQENDSRKGIYIDPIRELKTILKHNGWSQRKFAAKLGVSRQFLCAVLKGRYGAGKKILESLNIERVVRYRYK